MVEADEFVTRVVKVRVLFKVERQMIISGLIDREGSVRVADLANRLHVSHQTIRRDLAELSKQRS